jgi:hypothetical protein
MGDANAALARFLRAEQAPESFHHRDHLAVAHAMLGLMPLADAGPLYARGLKAIAGRAGRPQAFHETLTVAYLALIAERIAEGPGADFAGFLKANPDLEDPAILGRWYEAPRLNSDLARRQFILPSPRA